MIYKLAKKKDGKESLNVPNVKLFSKIIFNIFGFFCCLLAEKDSLLDKANIMFCFFYSCDNNCDKLHISLYIVLSKTCKLAVKPNKKLVP